MISGPITFAILCLAGMIVRLDPKKILTKGFDLVLESTEIALKGHKEIEKHAMDLDALRIANYIWGMVGDVDPATLIPFFELWYSQHGWKQQTSRLLADKILQGSSRHPYIIEDSIKMFENIQSRLENEPRDSDPSQKYLKELTCVRVKIEQKKQAEIIVAGLNWDKTGTSPAIQAKARSCSNPSLDMLMDRLTSNDELQQIEAVSELENALRNPSRELAEVLCETVYTMFQENRWNLYFPKLFSLLIVLLRNHPQFAPLEMLQEWSLDERLDDEYAMALYSILAKSNPEYILTNAVSKSLTTSVISVNISAIEFLTSFGVIYPDLVINFMIKWIENQGYSDETCGRYIYALEDIAKQVPAERQKIIAFFQQLRGTETPIEETEETGDMVTIDLGFDIISRAIEKLKELETSK